MSQSDKVLVDYIAKAIRHDDNASEAYDGLTVSTTILSAFTALFTVVQWAIGNGTGAACGLAATGLLFLATYLSHSRGQYHEIRSAQGRKLQLRYE